MFKKHFLGIVSFFVLAIIIITPYFSNITEVFGRELSAEEISAYNSDRQKRDSDGEKDAEEKDRKERKKEDFNIKVISPQNGSIVDQNFQINIKEKEELVSASVHILETASGKPAGGKTIDLKRVGNHWTGVADIGILSSDIYYFQVRGSDEDGNEYKSKTFWINVDKLTTKEKGVDVKEERKAQNIRGIEAERERREIKREEEKVLREIEIERREIEREEEKALKEAEREAEEKTREEERVLREIEKEEGETEQEEIEREAERKRGEIKREEERVLREAEREAERERKEIKQEKEKALREVGIGERVEERIESEDVYLQINDLCTEVGLKDESECLGLFQKQNICKDLNKDDCRVLTSDIILDGFISKEEIEKAEEKAENIIGHKLNIKNNSKDKKTKKFKVSVKKDDKILETDNAEIDEFIEKFIPLHIEERGEVNLIVLDTKNKSGKLISAMIAVDDDADGIPNDSEERLGTSSNNPDTDQDGVSDYDEVISGSNPLGPGKIAKRISNRLSEIDLAIINNRSIEQPKESGVQTDDLSVEEVVNTIKANTEKAVFLQGKAFPNSIVTLYVYSQMPIVMTTRTDENGNWTYTLDEGLVDGVHQVYVAVNDDTGKVRYKSSPLSFFVKEARAVTRADYLSLSTSDRSFTNEFGDYIFNSLIIIFLIIGLYLFLVRKQSKNLPE